ncbi:TPA: hypothetical protein H9419_002340 [Listeria monocytogenes]|nr:hypothetical protein [Listeria monocytogenes]RJC97674.1 hypothetical protein D3B38_10285 [Listeria monocytogenes]HAB0144190.1 hypothetical protein [Listeria monocytogenes]HAM1567423.1 hypothetical protein [Listeria monocytogenes]
MTDISDTYDLALEQEKEKDKAIEKLFAELYETRKLKALQRRIKKNEMDLKSIYDEYLQHLSIVNS